MANNMLYGFHNLESIWDRRITDADIPIVGDAVAEALAEHRRQFDNFFGLLVERHTLAQRGYRTTAGHRLQPRDEYGRVRKVQVAPGQYTVGYPLQDAGDAFGRTYDALLKMTVAEVNDVTASLIDADLTWVRDQILARLLNPAEYTYVDDEVGSVTVKGLANAAGGDTDTYQIQEGSFTAATDTHYLAQASAIDDANDPFDTDRAELVEHPENGGEVIAFVSSSLVASIEALSGFYVRGRSEIRRGANTDELIADFPVNVPGVPLGFHEAGVWISEWAAIPSGYMFTVTTDGAPAIGMREDEVEQLRGFRQQDSRDSFPFYEQYYGRKAGFGAWNKVGAVVRRIGNGTYAAPAPYNRLPLP